MLLLVKLRLVLGNPLLLLLLVGLWVLKHRVLLLLLKLRLCSEAVSIAVCLFNFLMVVLFCNFLEVLLLFVSPLFGIFPAFFEGGFGFILSLLCLYMSNKLPGILNSLWYWLLGLIPQNCAFYFQLILILLSLNLFLTMSKQLIYEIKTVNSFVLTMPLFTPLFTFSVIFFCHSGSFAVSYAFMHFS